MAKKFLDTVYETEGNRDVKDLYDEWSGSYDDEVMANGYATPTRVAEALHRTNTPLDTQILDFGCGTGLSGQALVAQGYTTIDGCDLSPEMLAEAEAKGIYGRVWVVEDPDGAPAAPGVYEAITATGVISPGAAPIGMLSILLDLLGTGGRLAFSFNDHAVEDATYTEGLRAAIDAGTAEIIFEEYGPHLPEIGLRSVVYVLEKK